MEDRSLNANLMKNTLMNGLTLIISKLGSLIFTIIIARYLLPYDFGLYNLALTIIITLSTFSDLGLNVATIKYLSEKLNKNTKKARQEAHSRFIHFLKLKFLLTLVISISLYFLARTISTNIFKEQLLTSALKIGAVYLIFISIQGTFSSLFQAIKKVKYNAASETLSQIVKIILTVFIFMFYKSIGMIFVIFMISSVFLYLFI